MRVIFLGTPEFAIPSLKALLESSCKVCAVFTQPDRPAGRGHKLHPSPVKAFARESKIPIFQPEKIGDPNNRHIFEDLQPDYIVVVAFGQILPGWILGIPQIAPVNVHGSLLPKYRGAAPVARAIMNGEKITGVTTMIMVEKLDAGPILQQQAIAIPDNATAGEMARELAKLGSRMLVKTLKGLSGQLIQPIEQNDDLASYARRLKKEESDIEWTRSCFEIHNQVRGLNPWPLACTKFGTKNLQIFGSQVAAETVDKPSRAGTYLGMSQTGMLVQCGRGILELLEVQLEGKKRISGREFANGVRIQPGASILGLVSS